MRDERHLRPQLPVGAELRLHDVVAGAQRQIMPILITRPAPPQIGTVHLVPDVSQLGEMIGDFKQAIKAARFADDSNRGRCAALIGRKLQQGRGRVRFQRYGSEALSCQFPRVRQCVCIDLEADGQRGYG